MPLTRPPARIRTTLLTHRLRSVLRSARGAFDLPSILVGVVVVGVLTAGVLAAIFGAIPFAQDNGAKQDLAALRTAEGVARVKDGRFMNQAELTAAGYVSGKASAVGPSGESAGGFERAAAVTAGITYSVETNAPGTCYLSISRSGSGTIFYASDSAPDPQILAPTTPTTCLTAAQTQALIDGVGGFDASRYTPSAPANMAGTVQSPTTVGVSWNAAQWATGYKVETRINGGTWTPQSASQTATTATVTATQGDTVDVRVTALNTAGSSAPVTTTTTLPSLPGAPTNLISSASTPTAGTFTWNTVSTATGYKVESRVNGGAWTVLSANQAGTSAVINATGPATVDIRVTAINQAGTSASNATASVNLPSPPPDFSKPAAWTTGSGIGNGMWTASSMSADGKTMLVSDNYLRASGDSGATWVSRMGGSWTSMTLSANGAKLIATDSSGYVYTSTDLGATVTPRTSLGSGGWTGSASSTDGTKLAVSRNDATGIYTSADSGASWTARTLPGAGNVRALASSADGTKLVAGRSGDSIYTSTDSGATWIKRTNAGVGAWYTMSSSADGTKLIAGRSSGNIYTSVDSGATWTARTSVGTSWYTTASSADGTKLVIGGPSGVFTSADAGVTWIQQTTMQGTGAIMTVSISADGTRMAAGRNGGAFYIGAVGS